MFKKVSRDGIEKFDFVDSRIESLDYHIDSLLVSGNVVKKRIETSGGQDYLHLVGGGSVLMSFPGNNYSHLGVFNFDEVYEFNESLFNNGGFIQLLTPKKYDDTGKVLELLGYRGD